jgi:hypothetical protein
MPIGIEGAASGFIQDAIDDTFKSIASSLDGVAEQRIFISKNGAGRVVEHLLHHPQIAANVMLRVVGNGITSDDPVVIVREALRLHERLSSARGAAVEVRKQRARVIESVCNLFAPYGHQMDRAISKIDDFLRMSKRKGCAKRKHGFEPSCPWNGHFSPQFVLAQLG